MKASDLLPGSPLYPSAENFICTVTARIAGDNVANIPSNWTDAYWLGWINYDNLPYAYKSFQYTKDANNIIHFDDITKQTNYDVGYGLNSTSNNYPALLRYDEEHELWRSWDRQWSTVDDNTRNLRLLNEYDINQTAVTNVILIFAFNPKLNGVGQSYTMGYLIVPIEDFLNNNFSGTISTANNNLTNFFHIYGATLLTSIDITQDDVGGIHTQTINGLEVDYFCCGIEVIVSDAIDPTGTTIGYNIAVKPLLRMQNIINDDTYISCSYNQPDGFGYQEYCGEGIAYNATAGVIWENTDPNISANPRPILDGSVVGGNIIGTIDTDAVRNIFGRSGTYGFYYAEGNNFVIQATNDAARMIIRRICSYEDLYKVVSLYPRLGTVNSYDNGSNKWYPYVVGNEFTTQIINGLTDRPKLTTWQLIGQTINPDNSQYEESDKPEYIPPEDDDPGDKGDIDFNTNCPPGISSFLTQYIMTAGQIKVMGNNLWRELSTSPSNMVTNFFKLFNIGADTTYELSMADVIDYFISIKYFPFDLYSLVPCIDASESGIRAGLGTTLISSGSPPKVPKTSMVILDGGTATIPSKYNSFLDHEPYTSVSVYVPYCGTVDIPASLIRNATLSLKYSVDLVTGSCMAIISKSGDGASYPIANLTGTVGFEILLTGNNASTVQANINNATNNSIIRSTSSAIGLIPAGLTGDVGSFLTALGGTARDIGNNAVNLITSMPQLAGTRPLIAGTSSCLNAVMSPQTAYVQIRYKLPVQEGFSLVGGISDKVMKISAANGMGYVKVVNPRLDGLKCTHEEINMIKEALAKGIFT